MSSSGLRSKTYLCVALTPVIYRSSGAMIPDLEAGHVLAGMTIGSEFIEQHRGGRLKLLAQSLAEGRWALAPEVPRFNEQGIGFVGSWVLGFPLGYGAAGLWWGILLGTVAVALLLTLRLYRVGAPAAVP